MSFNPYVPHPAEVVERVDESSNIFTLRLRFTDPELHTAYQFLPGQFNMVYLYGVGEVPISIVSDPQQEDILDHTIRVVGRVTRGLARLQKGDRVGIRGPYGRGWPLLSAEEGDVMLVTGGLGCAPVVSVINYIMRRRDRYQKLIILQGVKHANDLIWRQHYERWAQHDDTQVLLSADVAGGNWPWLVGKVTALLDQAKFDPSRTTVMMCGPEIMMRFTIQELLQRNVSEQRIWLSMERNMQCALGICGHCQYGAKFICKDGPVFPYPEIKEIFATSGY